MPLLADAENQAARDPPPVQQLPGREGAAEGQDNLAANLEAEDDLLPNLGLPFQLALMEPFPINQGIIEDEEEDEETDGENGNGEEQAGIENENQGQGGENVEEGNEGVQPDGNPQQQQPLFAIGSGGAIDSSDDDDNDEFLTPPNRSTPRRNPIRNTLRRNANRDSKLASLRKLAELRRNRQI